MNLRDFARDMPCLVRLPCCNGRTDTTVLAHYRLAGTCGVGMKPSDSAGAHACAACHSAIDGHTKPPAGYTHTDIRLAHAEGVIRTLDAVRQAGYELTKRKGR